MSKSSIVGDLESPSIGLPERAPLTNIFGMGPRLSVSLLLLPIAALLGCGASNSSSSTSNSGSGSASTGPPTTAPYNFNGLWWAFVPSNAFYLPVTQIELGSLKVTNGSVTGTVMLFEGYGGNSNACSVANPNQNNQFAATGTLDAAHNLTLNVPIAGGIGTLYAALGDNPATYVSGSWQILGGSCAMPATQVDVYQSTPASPPTTSAPAPITANLSGQWSMGADYTAPVNGQYVYPKILGFGGILQFANGSVSGNLYSSWYPSGGCGPLGTAAVTGTIDSNNNLTLTVPLGGSYGTATITATLGGNPQTVEDGSYQVTGGYCAMPATAMTIAQYAPTNGTYSGTFGVVTSSAGVAATQVTVTVVLSQSPTPASGGTSYPVTGTYTVTGACTDSGSIAQLGLSGFLGFYPFASYPTATILTSDGLSTPKCPGPYQGVLVKQ